MKSPGIPDLTRRAVTLHQAGDLTRAEALYRDILAEQPKNFDALHLLGVLACQRGDLALSTSLIKAALSVDPISAPALVNLAIALRGLGREQEAIEALDRTLDLSPNNLVALQMRGAILLKLARPEEALADYDNALAIRPDDVETIANRSAALLDLDRIEDALAGFDRALAAKPDLAELHYNRGVCLQRLNRQHAAVEAYDRALSVKANYVAALSNKAAALISLGRYPAAIRECDLALTIARLDTEVLNNKALALTLLGQAEKAEALYRSMLDQAPGHTKAHLNLAHILLVSGRFQEGWQHHEWRRSVPGGAAIDRDKPRWDGGALTGRTLLVRAEQGYGDTIQFCRYLPLIAKKASVIVEVPAALERLISRLPGIARVVVQGEALPHFDVYCPMLSLPAVFGTTVDTIPAAIPYLAADPVDRQHWRQRLAPLAGLRVGLVWAGRSNADRFDEKAVIDAARSVTLERLGPLAAVDGISFISLQTGDAAGQAGSPPSGMVLHDFTDLLSDFAETAALIDGLDLVISVDTAVAHLAGALGKPIWLLNRFDTCWRWLLERRDSPWYPTMRVFRQPSPGDWASVLSGVTAELAIYASSVNARV